MTEYAKNKPSSFKNGIERIAIVGAGGTIGAHLVSALLKPGKHTITALTRKDSTNALPTGVHIAPIDYTDESTIITALKNQQFFIITISPTAPRDTHSKLVQAAAKAGVPYVMPNSYAGDIDQVQLGVDTLLGPAAKANRDEIEELGMKWIAVCCGFWYDYSLAGGERRFGFDFEKRSLTIYDDGKTPNSVSTLAQVGRAVASVLSLPLLPQDEDDRSLTVSAWFNKPLYLKSFVLNQNQMFESVKRITGTSDNDWTVTRESTKQRYEEGIERVKRGDVSAFAKMLYARAFYAEDPSDCADKAQNGALGLEEEGLDGATRDAIELVKELGKRSERMAS